MTDNALALQVISEAAAKLEPLWDYLPNRPLGWIDQILSGMIEHLRDQVQQECATFANRCLDIHDPA